MLAYANGVCRSCGNPRSVCSDPKHDWWGQHSVCYATASREVLTRRLLKKYDKKPQHEAMDLHPLDGLSVWVTNDKSAADDFFD